MTHSPSSAQSDLLPCPFCGGTDFRIETADVQPDNYWSGFVQCTTCDACGPEPDEWLGSDGQAEQAAREFWNRRAAASANTIGEDAANVAIGEREAFDESEWRAIYNEITSHSPASFNLFCTWMREEIIKDRAALTAEKVAAEPIYQVLDPIEGGWSDGPRSLYDATDGAFRRIVYAAPQQPAQPVAQPVEHSDEWRAGYVAGCNDSESKFNFAQGVEPVIPENLHPDTAKLVRRFARSLGNKLLSAQIKYGYSNNWQRDDWADECRAELMRHIAKGDPRDVAAYCAFLWHHDWPTAAAQPVAQTLALTDEQIEDLQEAREILENMVRSVELDGNYSTEATCTFLRQALLCLPAAQPASSIAEGDK